MGAVYTKKFMADFLELTERRVQQLAAEGIFQEQAKGCYVFGPTVQAYIRYLRRQISDDDSASDYNTEKARLTKVKREAAELELKIRTGESHTDADVAFVMANMLVAFRARLLVMKYKVVPKLLSDPSREHMIAVLGEAIEEALNELSEAVVAAPEELRQLAGADADTNVSAGVSASDTELVNDDSGTDEAPF